MHSHLGQDVTVSKALVLSSVSVLSQSPFHFAKYLILVAKQPGPQVLCGSSDKQEDAAFRAQR